MLSAKLAIGVSPAPDQAQPFQKENYAFPKVPDDIGMATLESNAVKLTIHEGSDTDYWVEALDDPDAEVRFVAAHTLTAALPLAEPARLKMAAHVKDPDARVRKSAARALQLPAGAKLAGPDTLARDPAVAGLIDALKDANPGVRTFAVAALATWGRTVKASAPALIPLLQDKEPGVRLAAADALGDMFRDGGPDEQALGHALAGALKDADEQVVKSSIVALGRLKTPDAVPALLPFCTSGNPALSRAAIEGIGESGSITPAVEIALFAALKVPETRSAAAASLGKLKADPNKLLPALIAALKSEENEFGRVSIVRALGSCGAAAIPVLLEALKKDSESCVREYAAATLAAMPSVGKETVPALVEALADSSDDVKVSAANALGRIGAGAKAAVSELSKLATHQNPAVRSSAEDALSSTSKVVRRSESGWFSWRYVPPKSDPKSGLPIPAIHVRQGVSHHAETVIHARAALQHRVRPDAEGR